MPELLDPPAPTETYSPDQAQGLFNPESAPSKPAPTPEKVATTETVVDDKPDAMKPEKPEEKKDRLGKLGAVKKPEEPKVEEAKVEAKVEDDPLKDAPGPKQLRDAYNALKAEHGPLKEKATKLETEYKQIQSELGLTKEELGKLKAMNLNPEEREKFVHVQKLNAERVLKDSDAYKNDIIAPIQAQFKRIENLAAKAKLTPVNLAALQNAMDIPDELERGWAIKSIFEDADVEPSKLNDFCAAAADVAMKLNEQHYPKMEAKLAEARDIEKAAREKDKNDTEQAGTKEKEEYTREFSRVHDIYAGSQFKAILEDTGISVDGTTMAEALKSAEPATDATGRASQALCEAAMPFAIEFINKLWARTDAAERAIKTMNGSGPKRTDSLPKDTPTETKVSADEMFKNPANFGMAR